MNLLTGHEGHERAIEDLVARTFAASEGADEGALIGGLVRDILGRTPPADIRVFRAEDEGRQVGAAVFTRLRYPGDPCRAVLLSPMAVAPERQRRGIGLALLAHALRELRAEGAEVAITYGDPAYYARAGFAPIPEDRARAPQPLSLPHGWIGRSLADGPIPRLSGRPLCVPALDRADIW